MFCVSHAVKLRVLASWIPFSAAASSRNASTLVLVESKAGGRAVAPSTLNTLSAALALKLPITALVSGNGVMGAAEEVSRVEGVTKVVVAQHARLEHQLAEPLADLVVGMQREFSFTHILAPGSAWGKNLLPRAGAMLGIQPVADVSKVVDADTFVRPIHAGNALATVRYKAPGVRMATVRTSSFPPAPLSSPSPPAAIEMMSEAALLTHLLLPPSSSASISGHDPATSSSHSRSNQACQVEWLGVEGAKQERPELGTARVVICGGRALGSKEAFDSLESLADAFGGGAVGASRAAVDGAMAPNELQVGQTGRIVAPELYIGIGISGAIQHMAGVKDSKVIVAINTDKEAPIFQAADYGLVADWAAAVPELEKSILAIKKDRMEGKQ